jgi:hypothetical protein
VRGASPEGGDARWNLLRSALARRWRWIGAHRPGSCHATREPSSSTLRRRRVPWLGGRSAD